eukprot:c13000_g2_i1.p1 GENE.c13000_g2_i1~~c13000_g2_i1.p1  ORF type:complete len:787 (-),score=182.84 c13000_g2_i1:202-2310(-)
MNTSTQMSGFTTTQLSQTQSQHATPPQGTFQQQQQQRNDRDSSLNNNNKTSKPTITTIQEQQKCLAAVPAVSNNRTTSRLSLNVASPAMQRQASNGGDGGQSKRAGEVGYGYGHGHDATGHQGVKEFPVLDSHMHVHNVWKAFVEVYRQGVYVKEYARVNEKAFAKILKKFDKHFHQDLSSTILPLIESEYCFCGKHLSQLVSAMENVWTKHHTHEPHHGMHTLREVKDFSRRFWNVRDSFWVGLVIGIALALGAVVLSRVPSVNILSCDFSAGVAMLRAFLLAVIAVWLWGVTVHVWQQSFHPYRTILDLPCAISVPHTFQWAATGSVSCAVSMYILVRVTGYGHSTPHDTVWGAVLVAVCGAWCGVPRIITRHARCLYRRIAVLLARAVLLPQRKVTIAEEWMVEQLMCLGVVSSDIVHCLCYLFADSYRNTHHCVDHHIWVRGIIFALPSVLRLGQCVRKLRTSDTLHARYTHVTRACFCILSIAITVFSSIFSHVHYKSLFGLWAVLAVVTVVGISAWDVHHDWGFFTTPKNSPDWPLRQGLSMFPKQRAPYYAMAVTNLVLRVAWVWNITNDFGWIENEVFWKFIAAGLELLRRCQWSMVSMEHLHNTHHTTPRKQQSKAINTAFAFGVHTKHVTSSAQLQPGPRAFWSASPPRSARDAPISEIVISVPHLSDRGATTFESIDSVAPLLPSSMHSAT